MANYNNDKHTFSKFIGTNIKEAKLNLFENEKESVQIKKDIVEDNLKIMHIKNEFTIGEKCYVNRVIKSELIHQADNVPQEDFYSMGPRNEKAELKVKTEVEIYDEPLQSSYIEIMAKETHEIKNELMQREDYGIEVKEFESSHCNKAFLNKGNLESHRMNHSAEKKLQCNYCEKVFSTNNKLQTHREIHTDQKAYKCSHCDKAFSVRRHLTIHLRRHFGEKLYKCNHCDKGFSTNDSLKCHLMLHSWEKPYKCSHCDKRFSFRKHCKTHERIHTEKPFQCNECDKCFISDSHLLHHLETHTYQCLDCGSAFTDKKCLINHHKSHTNCDMLNRLLNQICK